jgi:hypothetical protein
VVETLSFLNQVMMNDVEEGSDDDDEPQSTQSELQRFWSAWKKFGKGRVADPLGWWRDHHTEFPIIAKMARDFLAIPGTSVSVERLFSKSRHLCTDVRSSLQAQTIMMALITSVWLRQGLYDKEMMSA